MSTNHANRPCPFLATWDPCGVDGCAEYHSNLLHGCTVQLNCSQLNFIKNTLLLIQRIKSTKGYINTFWDNGSTLALVTRAFAVEKKLHGAPVTYDLITVGGNVKSQDSMIYEVVLIDRNNQRHTIVAYEIQDICGSIHSIKVKGLVHLFPQVNMNDIKRPQGPIQLLIGMGQADIHPTRIASNEGLVLYKSLFGTGKIIGGTHRNIPHNESINPHAKQCANVTITNVRLKRGLDTGVDFFTAEDFGVKIPLRCGRCKACPECRFEVQQLSRIEQKELEVIRNNLQLDPVNKRWTTTFPYNCNPDVLESNKAQALALMLKTEKRLLKDPVAAKAYNEQFDDFSDRDVIDEISKEEEMEYPGPDRYVVHHEVYKPESSTTPVRVVVNSSLKYKGISLNDICMKGPKALNMLYAILLRFRTHQYALVGDIHKFYHSIHTTEKEKHLRKLLWRHLKTDEEPKTYGITRLMFGDKSAAAISSVALQQTAEIYSYIDEKASQRIKNDAYVDDITTGDDTRDGVVKLKTNIENILDHGGFKAHKWVASGDALEGDVQLPGTGEVSRVLGLSWKPISDTFSVDVKINLSRKFKGAHTESDYTYEEIPRILEIVITRRMVLGVVNSCYDPYGLISPITVQLKIELRKLFGKEMKIGWDDPLSREIKNNWVRVLQTMKKAEKVTFRRCIRPITPVTDKPTLIVSNDGSTDAMCATAHVRWELVDGTVECNLFAAKTRVTPIKKETIPRIEVQSSVMGVRLSKEIQEHSQLEFKEVVHILDSKCTLAALNKDTVALREYMANRCTEVLETTEVHQWYHVASKENIADLGTRNNAKAEDIKDSNDWQRGRPWMRLPKDKWPATQDYAGTSVPEEELTNKPLLVAQVFVAHVFAPYDIEGFRGRSYNLLLRVTALVMKMCRLRHFSVAPIIATEIEMAEKFLIELSMIRTKVDFDKGKLKSLGAQLDNDGIIVIGSRALDAMKSHYGANRFPILTYTDPLAHIWMQHVHEEDHSGVTKTVAKSRRMFWVINGRRLAEKIKRSCYRCRLTEMLLAAQKMAPLPKTRTKIAPVFTTSSMDLFGPIEIKDTVKKRTRMKVWGVIFNCTVTRAVYLDVTEDYSTDSILETIRKFISIRGSPSEIISDQGSQLKAASKEIASLVEEWDWKVIHDWVATKKIKWTFVPSEGQHQNGLSESLIKSVKKSLKHKVTSNVMTFSQLQMIMYEVANIINSRPIGILTGSDPEHPCPITPNDLILGRATADVPQGPFTENQKRSLAKRFQFNQQLISDWWKAWYQTVFPTLVPSYKWLQRHRNVKIGDVCLIRYKNELRATYRLGRVIETRVGTDGLVRTIVLKYKLPNEKVFRNVERPIQGVSVIVPIEEQNETATLNPDAVEFTPQQ